jgi:hypothetical protein
VTHRKVKLGQDIRHLLQLSDAEAQVFEVFDNSDDIA